MTGSQHQKMVIIRNADGVFAFCGGSDIANHRLGREGIGASEERSKLPFNRLAAPWHDVQVRVWGPAVADLWRSFVQRFREVAQNRLPGTDIRGIPVYGQESLREPDVADRSRTNGTLDVCVVRTYPNRDRQHRGDWLIQPPFKLGCEFARHGEMGIFEALVNALEEVKRTIYLEDQYLVASAAMQGWPPITEFVRRAIEQSSFEKMVIVVAGTGTVQGELYQVATRRAEFVRQLGADAAKKVSMYVYRGDVNSPYWFHSKTWVFDDEFALVSSANCNRRSYSCDSEIGVAVRDGPSSGGRFNFAHRLRMDLWMKHLNARPQGNDNSGAEVRDEDVRDFTAAAKLWQSAGLLQEVKFDVNPEPDLSIGETFLAAHPSVRALVKKLDRASAPARPPPRDDQWSFIDPDGS